MDALKILFRIVEEGDNILAVFPDMYSFFIASKWISENYIEPLWLIWTDIGVERINHISRKYGFPTSGRAVIVNSNKVCEPLNTIYYLNIIEDIDKLGDILSEDRVVISFGIDFLKIYNSKLLNEVIKLIAETNRSIIINAIFDKTLLDVLIPFHDALVEIVKNEDIGAFYHPYVAKLKFYMKNGSTVISIPLNISGSFDDIDEGR